MGTSSTFVATSGDGYERLMGRWSRQLADPFIDFCAAASGDVLDAGCGTGSLSFALARRDGIRSIRGVDLSAAYIQHAANRNDDPRLSFNVGDICALPFKDASFDAVLCLLVLHFVPASDIAIEEMRRVARPGATIAAAVWDVRGGFVANRIFFDTAAALDPRGNQRRARNYTRPLTRPGELRQAWSAAGLRDVRDETLAIRMNFSSFEDYWAPYTGSDGPGAEYVATLDPADRRHLRDKVEQAYLDGEPDGPRSYAAIAWAVAGSVPD